MNGLGEQGGELVRSLELYVRRGLWALPLWAVLLFAATFTHQPPYQTNFPDWSRYVTTPQFLISHLVGSILGAAIGIFGFVALSIVMVYRGAPRLALWALLTTVIGTVFTTGVFGIAAYAQPAIGRAYLAGHADVVALYNDVNGVPLLVTAGLGVLLLSAGLIMYGIGVVRSGLVRRLAGWALAVGGPLFAIVGVILADVVQSIGAALIVVGTSWIAWTVARHPLAEAAPEPAI
jgi:hypothetical protein